MIYFNILLVLSHLIPSAAGSGYSGGKVAANISKYLRINQVEAVNVARNQEQNLTVWLFMDPECPISQAYTLRLRSMVEEYKNEAVQFQAVYPSYTLKPKDIRRFHQKYGLPFPGQKDNGYQLSDRLDATVTPEAVVTDAQGQVVYRGAIDNWYYALGRNRTEPTEHYLKDALDAALQGLPVQRARTQPIGCMINR
ncbi:redoxin domain-containing protein [Telluribacter sp. SYSU D00476]|uniref:redoxin domain-containing protein n=1 Tax=Telluribacter sp. SYSU D00476 TaxID=2811430 RepID=UPI0021D42474|nr:redoxin domain-containing protein [Telluribacter sp. SYSU D00476]